MRRKTRNISIRCSDAQFNHINDLCMQAGMTKQALFDALVNGVQLPTKEDTDAIIALEKAISAMNIILRNNSNNLNQIAKKINSGDNPSIDEEIIDLEITTKETAQEVQNIWQSLKPLIQARMGAQP